jgi:hypothetical protein
MTASPIQLADLINILGFDPKPFPVLKTEPAVLCTCLNIVIMIDYIHTTAKTEKYYKYNTTRQIIPKILFEKR